MIGNINNQRQSKVMCDLYVRYSSWIIINVHELSVRVVRRSALLKPHTIWLVTSPFFPTLSLSFKGFVLVFVFLSLVFVMGF